MELSDPAMSAYSNARLEYTAQLNQFLVPALMKFVLELLEKAHDETAAEPKRLLWQFQMYLNDIPDWNIDRVQREVHQIQIGTGCEYLEDLITAIFIAHTKILTAIQVSSKKRNLNISVPKVEYFLFKVLCETSKLLWKAAYLLRDNVSNIEKQQNYQQVERIIEQGIVQAIRCLVPVKTILRDCMAAGDERSGEDDSGAYGAKEEEDSDDDEEEAVIAVVPVASMVVPEPVALEEEEVIAAAAAAPEPVALMEVAVPSQVEEVVPTEPEKSSIPLTVSPAVDGHSSESTTEAPSNQVVSAISSAVSNAVANAVDTISSVLSSAPAVLSFNTSKRVGFTDLNPHFDSDNPDESDIIYEPHSDYEEGYGTLEIKEEAPITADDFDTFDDGSNGVLAVDDYEVMG